MLASYRVSWMLKESYSSCRSSTFRPLKTFRTGIALQGYLLMDGLEAPARPCEIDHPVRVSSTFQLRGGLSLMVAASAALELGYAPAERLRQSSQPGRSRARNPQMNPLGIPIFESE